MNCEVTTAMIETELKDYEVVCSIGAKPKEIESFKQFKQTMTADDILAGRTFPGRKIVILGGGSVGCENTITYVKEGVEHHIDDAYTLLFAVGYIPLKMENERANYIGDCDKVGNLKDAIGAAYQLAKTL